MDIKAAIEDRVDCTVEQRQRLGEGVDRVCDEVLVLGPDVYEMNGEVRRPTAYERADDT